MKRCIQRYKWELILVFLILYAACMFWPLWDMTHIISFSLAVDLVRPILAFICVLLIMIVALVPELKTVEKDDWIHFGFHGVKIIGFLLLFLSVLLSAKTMVIDILLEGPNRLNERYMDAAVQMSGEVLESYPSVLEYSVEAETERRLHGWPYDSIDLYCQVHFYNRLIVTISAGYPFEAKDEIERTLTDRCAEIRESSGYNRVLLHRYTDTFPSIDSDTEIVLRYDTDTARGKGQRK